MPRRGVVYCVIGSVDGMSCVEAAGSGLALGSVRHRVRQLSNAGEPDSAQNAYFFWTNASQRSSAFTPSWDAHHLADSSA